MYQNWLSRTGGLGCRAAAVAILASSRMAAGEAPEVFPGSSVRTTAAARAAAVAAAMTIAGVRRRRVAGLPAGGLPARRSSLIRCSLRVCWRPAGRSRSAGAGSSWASSAMSLRGSLALIGSLRFRPGRVFAVTQYLFAAARGFPAGGRQLAELAAGPRQPGPPRPRRPAPCPGGPGGGPPPPHPQPPDPPPPPPKRAPPPPRPPPPGPGPP